MNRVVIAGGSGFIGRHLQQEFFDRSYEVVVLTRDDFETIEAESDGVRHFHWDGKTLGDWTSPLEGAAAVINLAGRSIATRLNEPNKKEILDSRTVSTDLIGKAIVQCENPPRAWINASAVGYYGDRGDEVLTEQSTPGADFLAEVAQAWEEPLTRFDTPATRKVRVRIGFVLGRGGGALPPMAQAAKLFLGGPMGSGRQWIPWIHIEDLSRIFRWLVESEGGEGSYNACAPNPVRNEDFMQTLRLILNRPWAPPAPAPILRLLGKVMPVDPSLSLISTRATPKRATEQGFEFNYTALEPALRNLLS